MEGRYRAALLGEVFLSSEGCLGKENQFHFKSMISDDLNIFQEKPNNKEDLGVQIDSSGCE